MNCSLNCFCDFYEAPTTERRDRVVRRYNKPDSGQAKGCSTYYNPVLHAIKDRLCPGGTVDEKITAIANACINPRWRDQQNEVRKEANLQLYHAFRSAFGAKVPKIFASPRMRFLASNDVSVNIQPELYFELDGKRTILKLGVAKKNRPEKLIRIILQMMHRATKTKGIAVPIDRIIFLDARANKTYVESKSNPSLEAELAPIVSSLAERWKEAS